MALIHGQHGAGAGSESRPVPIGIFETGVTELVGADEQVDQNDYGAHATCNLHGSGEILGAAFLSTGGAILEVGGKLLIFNAGVTVAAGDTSITAVERAELCGWIDVSDSAWQADANGASQYICDQPVAFDTDGLYLVWFHESATTINSDGGDDEVLSVNLFYRLDHRES